MMNPEATERYTGKADKKADARKINAGTFTSTPRATKAADGTCPP